MRYRGGQVQEPVGFGAGLDEAFGAGVGSHVADLDRAAAGWDEHGDSVAVGEGRGGGSGTGGRLGDDPRRRGHGFRKVGHRPGRVDEDADGQLGVGDRAAYGALPGLGGGDGAAGAAVAVAGLNHCPPDSDTLIRRWLAQALALGPWLDPLRALAHYVPEVALAIADEHLRVRREAVTDRRLEQRDNRGRPGR
ncbi:hypothetical protein [Micromonospora sp. ATCC 39149]|uniref:Uncharacterized protein n=1 Tax=Micromonospora carbonacea TaxID=47853 RepID=A0A7D5YIV4_9ACTN|nr:hypothetical protein [Micromonospora sp. ATCC 39149]QLK00557.1 hypothetical protein HZU44_11330 [Micromonospora carbonacea]